MMTGLIRQNSTIPCPGTAPGVLIIIVLPSTPSDPYSSHNKLAKSIRLQCLSQLLHWNIESILLNNKESDTALVTGAYHPIGIIKRKRHWLFDNDMFFVLCKVNDMLSVATTLSQNH